MRGPDRSLPLADREVGQGGGEISAKELGEFLVGPIGVLPEQHEGVAELSPAGVPAGAQVMEQGHRVLPRIGSPISAQKQMPERGPARLAVPLGMRRVVRLDLVRSRRRHVRVVLQHERHLLREPAAHDGVVTVKAQTLRLAIKDLLLDRLVNQSLQLLAVRRAAPLRHPPFVNRLDLRVGHGDDTALGIPVSQPAVEREYADAQQEEQDER